MHPDRCRAASLALFALLAASARAEGQDERVVVASKNFAESVVLGELMTQLLQARTDLEVEHRASLGGTLVVFEAQLAGEVDIYADYTGTAWAVVLEREQRSADPLRTFLEVQAAYRERYDVEWLSPFGFDNTYAMAVRDELAEERGLERLSDLARAGQDLRGAFSIEFTQREDGWPGLAEHYGIELGSVRAMEHGLAYQALASGEVDLIDAYATDGKLLEYDVTVLEDDLGFFPPYHAAPLVRRELLERHPQVAAALSELAFRLPDARMQALNLEVERGRRSAAEVANAFLLEEGLIGVGEVEIRRAASRDSFAAFMLGRTAETGRLTLEHLTLTGISVLLAALAAIPAGIVLARRDLAARAALAVAGVLQTIPSLALLAFMIAVPGLGLSVRSAIAALSLYALLPILRNTITGMRGVDPLLVDTARGLGLTEFQVWMRVQLPLALPTIMAGVRTAAVISVGIATLAAFIGAGGLGDPIVNGLYLNDTWLILAGALPAAVLALVVDRLLGLLERRITPVGIRSH